MAEQQLSLQSILHAATRSQHARLNKLITARMPLSLPPASTDPTAYHLGMLAFGQIFLAFEEASQAVLRSRKDAASPDSSRYSHYVNVLNTLSTPGLERTSKFEYDATTLGGRLSMRHKRDQTNYTQAEKAIKQQGQARTAQITEHILQRPYLTLAYAWTLYLALFNGGRYLHRSLAAAGPRFWLEAGDSNISVLSFWHFDAATASDPNADQLKLRFKANFDAAAAMLTEAEHAEIADEAKGIFELCIELVNSLDNVTAEYAAPQTKVADCTLDLRSVSTAPGQCRPQSSSRIWDAVQAAGEGFMDGVVRNLWKRPISQEVKE